MVKVTIENDRCKNEITGEFFMGLMITEEEKTEDSTTYKGCEIRTGKTTAVAPYEPDMDLLFCPWEPDFCNRET